MDLFALKDFKHTFWQDFSIADMFGEEAVLDTYKASKHWIADVDYYKELVVVLNWKIWQHHESNEKLARVYDKLWREAHELAFEKLKGEALSEYINYVD